MGGRILEVRLKAWDKGRHGTLGEQDPDASLWLWWALPESRIPGVVRARPPHPEPQAVGWGPRREGMQLCAHLQT